MSRPSPTQHELSMSMKGLRAHYDDVPSDVAPHEPDPEEVIAAPAPIPASDEKHEKTSEPQADKNRGSYKTREAKASHEKGE